MTKEQAIQAKKNETLHKIEKILKKTDYAYYENANEDKIYEIKCCFEELEKFIETKKMLVQK